VASAAFAGRHGRLADCLPMDGIDFLGALRADGAALAAEATQ
jgi:hypothetical protein